MAAVTYKRDPPPYDTSPEQDQYGTSLPVPPNDEFAEQALIGAILQDSNQYEFASVLVKPDDFYQYKNRVIFEAMLKLASEFYSIDVVTVKNHLESIGELEAVGGLLYLVSLVNETPHTTHTSEYAKIVRDCAMLRSLLKSTQNIQQMVYKRDDTPVNQIIGDAQQQVFKIGIDDYRNQGLVKISDSATRAFSDIENLYNDPDQYSTRILTGFIDLDKLTSGFQRSDLVIIAGRPSMGKTAFAMNIAEHCAIRQNLKVAIFSLEMTDVQLAMRSLSSLSSVNSKNIREGNLGDGKDAEQNWAQISHALDILNEAPIFVDSSPGIAPHDIVARCRRLNREANGLDLIIIDYLQLMQVKDTELNRNTELSMITRDLKFLAKELNIPVIALSQLNRGVESRVKKEPMMADLRDSGAIEQDADIILFIYRDEVYDPDSKDCGTADIIVAKHRNGEIGRVKLAFLKDFTRFENLSKYEDVESSSYPLP